MVGTKEIQKTYEKGMVRERNSKDIDKYNMWK
jgi:hypothetical protein